MYFMNLLVGWFNAAVSFSISELNESNQFNAAWIEWMNLNFGNGMKSLQQWNQPNKWIIITVITWLLFISISLCYKVGNIFSY